MILTCKIIPHVETGSSWTQLKLHQVGVVTVAVEPGKLSPLHEPEPLVKGHCGRISLAYLEDHLPEAPFPGQPQKFLQQSARDPPPPLGALDSEAEEMEESPGDRVPAGHGDEVAHDLPPFLIDKEEARPEVPL